MKIVLWNVKEEVNEETQEKKLVEEKKEYTIPFVPAANFLEYLEIEAAKEDPTLVKVQDVRNLVPLIVKTYRNQFTEEEFYEGVPSHLLMETIDAFVVSLKEDPYADKHPEVTEEEMGKPE